MISQVPMQAIHHVTLTVSDLQRSCDFYTSLLGFQMVAQLGPNRVLLSNGKAVLALTLPPNPSKAIANDMFDENRVGLDHISFTVESRATLEEAVKLFNSRAISNGGIEDSGTIFTVAFRDPDNVQLELSAPKSE